MAAHRRACASAFVCFLSSEAPSCFKGAPAHVLRGAFAVHSSCNVGDFYVPIPLLDSLARVQGAGCVLAHNMGLGKTFQVITFLHTVAVNVSAASPVCHVRNSHLRVFSTHMARDTHTHDVTHTSCDTRFLPHVMRLASHVSRLASPGLELAREDKAFARALSLSQPWLCHVYGPCSSVWSVTCGTPTPHVDCC